MVTAATLLLKQDAQVHDWASKGPSLGGQARLSSWLFSLLRCKMSLILPKNLYGVTTERFVGPYKVKEIISSNAVKLELPSTVKIHPVVNVSRIRRYVGQVEGQRKEQLAPVIIEGEEEWEVERILNKRKVRGKDKYLVRWKGFTAESDTWEGRENLKNAQEAIEEFEKEYRQDMEDVARQEREEGTFQRRELPGRFTAKKLYRWSDKQYDQEYWGRMERNWR